MATALISAVILFGFFPFSSPATHSLKYHFIATSGYPDFPQFVIHGYINDMNAVHYDSENRIVVSRQKWMEDSLPADYWITETQIAHRAEEVFRSNIEILKIRFYQPGGAHIVQYMYGCEWDDESGQTNSFMQHGYDGEDFLSLDVEGKRWICPVFQALVTAHRWNRVTPSLEAHISYLTKNCTKWLQQYVQDGNNTLRRTVLPSVSVFKIQGTRQVFCHATGFYPEGVMITWMKDGVEIQRNVSVGETLPNEDGTFQKRAVLMLSPEELQGIKYTCEVVHSSGYQIHPLSLETSSTPPLGLLMGIIGSLILLSCVIFVIYKLLRRMNCDLLKKKHHKEDIQSLKHLAPASTQDPDVINRSAEDSYDSDDSEYPAPSVSSLDTVSSDQPLMKKSMK